jgi:hypothetical protein
MRNTLRVLAFFASLHLTILKGLRIWSFCNSQLGPPASGRERFAAFSVNLGLRLLKRRNPVA